MGIGRGNECDVKVSIHQLVKQCITWLVKGIRSDEMDSLYSCSEGAKIPLLKSDESCPHGRDLFSFSALKMMLEPPGAKNKVDILLPTFFRRIGAKDVSHA